MKRSNGAPADNSKRSREAAKQDDGDWCEHCARGWSPESWESKPILQMPTYEDKVGLASAKEQLSRLPPIVQPSEIDELRRQLREVEEGKRFLLQGGDCAERFLDCTAPAIEAKMKILLQMSLITSWVTSLPTVRIGRIAGQYAKPRSADYEKDKDGKQVLAFRGDYINYIDEKNRTPDPARLVTGYFHAAATLNYIRGLLQTDFADLHRASEWDLGYYKDLTVKKKYEEIATMLRGSLRFMDATCAGAPNAAKSVDFFTSHEGLFLPYEAALTRQANPSMRATTGKWYNTSAHLIWVGDRTRQLDGAHIEYLRGLQNPLGCKVGPMMGEQELVDVCKAMNPNNEKGKLVLISRFGADKVKDKLPPLLHAVKKAGINAIWQCDPMHGNTFKTKVGTEEFKTRDFAKILEEVISTFEVHRSIGSHLMGVHFELTGEDVTECIGGPQELSAESLPRNYVTYCDPRLNYAQSMDMAFRMSEHIAAWH